MSTLEDVKMDDHGQSRLELKSGGFAEEGMPRHECRNAPGILKRS